MTNYIGQGVTVEGIADNEFVFTFNAASDIQALFTSNMTGYGWVNGQVDPVGLAVTLDTSADTQVKLAHTGDYILGRIERIENRVSEGVMVVTVRTQGGVKMKVATGATVAIGDTVTGHTTYPGYVQTIAAMTATSLVATAANLPKQNIVTSIGTDTLASGSTQNYAIVLLK